MTSSARAADKINYEDHLQPILRNECTSCHNPDKKKAGLDVSSYQTLMAGSDSGPVVNPGDPDGSTIYKVVAHIADPYMPKGKGKLQDKDIEVFKKWIAGGALQTASGKPAIAKNRPKVNLAVAAAGADKPAGPIAMPKDLLIEPVVHTHRPGALMCLAASPWAPLAAIGGQHQVLLYNTGTLDLLGVIPYPDGDPYVTSFSRNGAVLLVGGGIAAKSGHVDLFDVATGRRVTRVGDEFDAVIAADISPDQSMVALGGPGKTLKIYSTADGRLLYSMKKHTDWVTAIGYSPDGVLLASGDRAGGLWVWESKSGNEFYALTGHTAAITAVCFRSDSNILASASEDGSVKLWEMENGKLVKSWNAHPGGVLSVSFTHDGRIVTCGRDRIVRIWKPDGSGLLSTQPFHDIALHATFDGTGDRVVAGDWTGAVRVFDSHDGKALGELSSDPPNIEDQLVALRKVLPESQSAREKYAADLSAAQAASDKSALDLQASNIALAEATLAIQAAPQPAKQHAQQVESEARKVVESRTRQAQAAAERLARLRPVAKQASENWAQVRSRVARLEAAQFNLKVWAARNELTARQAELEKLKDSLEQISASTSKAATQLAEAQDLAANGPRRIKARQDAIVRMTKEFADASTARESAQAALQQKLILAREAAQVAQKLSDAAARSPGDKDLVTAAAAAKASFDVLNNGIQFADALLLARESDATRLQEALLTSEAAMRNEKAALEAAPGRIAVLQKSANDAANDLHARQAAMDELVKSVAAARVKADELAAQYQRMMQQVSLASHAAQ